MKDAFQVLHQESLLSKENVVAGPNLLANPGFETGDFTGWTASADWAVGTLGGAGTGQYKAFISVATNATLESARVAVTAGTRYYTGLTAQHDTTNPIYVSYLMTVQIKWWNAPTGGSLVGTSTIYDSRLVPGQKLYLSQQVLAPAGATHASFYILASMGSDGKNLPEPRLHLDDAFLGAPATRTRPRLVEPPLFYSSPGFPRSATYNNLIFSNDATTGYKAARFRVYGPPEYLQWWMNNAIGHHIAVLAGSYGPVWEGMVWGMIGRVNRQMQKIAYDPLYNRVYGFLNGDRTLAFMPAIDADSVARYGARDKILNIQTPSTSLANAQIAHYLADHKQLRPIPDNTIDLSQPTEADYLEVSCVGYWDTLAFFARSAGVYIGWQYGASGFDTSILIATGNGVATPSSALNNIRVYSGNTWISADYSDVAGTGVVIGLDPGGTSNWIMSGQNQQDFIRDLLAAGDSNQRGLISGVWKDQKFKVQPRPTTVGYTVEPDGQGRALFRDAGGAPIPAALIQSGNFLAVAMGRTRWTKYADAIDDPQARLLQEWEFDAENESVRPLSADATPLDKILAQGISQGLHVF